MYKCLNCGHVFDDGEQAKWKEDDGWHDGCPVCKEAYGEAMHCSRCGGAFFGDELFGGYCFDCLREMLTPQTALAYMLDEKLFARYMFDQCWKSSVPERIGTPLELVMLKEYYDFVLRYEQGDSGAYYQMKLLEDFIFNIDDICEKERFGEWCAKKKKG